MVHFRNLKKPQLTLECVAKLHCLQSELWFSIILVILIFGVAFALSNIGFLRCDKNTLNYMIHTLSAQPYANTLVVVFVHALPLLALNGFVFTAIVLGFLWARQNYKAHSHNNIIFEHKATYWKMIDTLIQDPVLSKEVGLIRAELLKEVINGSPASGYEEGTQAIQVVGVAGGKSP